MSVLLAVSPHLDDAIFSAGALLARHAAAGWRVVVATCFTASMPDPRGFALACQLDKGLPADVDYMALRRAEDRAACAIIGAEAVHLPFPEAPHRGYDDAAALFGPALPGDEIAAPLAQALAGLVADLRPDLLLGPAGIGDHVDHGAVRRALPGPALLWADLPYARRLGFPPPSARYVPCAAGLDAKLTACLCYATQIPFQLGPMPDLSRLHFDRSEAFIEVGRPIAQATTLPCFSPNDAPACCAATSGATARETLRRCD